MPVTPHRPRPVPQRRPDREALARVAVISRRRAADVAVHLGAIVLILLALLAPATPADAGCGPSCGVTAAEAAAPDVTGPGGAPDGSGTDQPPPAEAAAAPAAALTSTPTVAVPTVTSPPVTAPTVTSPTVTAPTVTAPTMTATMVTAPAVTPPDAGTTSSPAAPALTAAPVVDAVPPSDTPTTTTGPSSTATVTTAPAATPTTTPSSPAPPAPGDGVTAATTLNWGQPTRADEFTGSLAAWGLYNGPGHAGNGRRSPAAATVSGGVLALSGDAAGTTAGMAWGNGAKYGRWEGRVRAPASDPSYHAVMLLWPDAENWPVGGEVDFMEMSDPARATTDAFLHYGAANSQLHGAVAVDATQWHNWAVEWTPDHITTFLDGVVWWTTSSRAALPPGPMHLCLQLDWFPTGRAVAPSTMQVDWVRYYAYAG